jgi:hypothetical protein
MNENTDLPALDTCALTGANNRAQRAKTAIFLGMATLPHFKIRCKGTKKK